MVTGSHNPRGHNGFNVLLGGEAVFGEALQALVATEGVNSKGDSVDPLTVGGIDVAKAYVERFAQLAEHASALHVVWDCRSGAVGAVIGALTARLPGRHRGGRGSRE
jgi:phosphomannomutase